MFVMNAAYLYQINSRQGNVMLTRFYNYIFGNVSATPPQKEVHPLFAAASQGNLEAVSAITKIIPDVDVKDPESNTPLIIASSENQLAAIAILLNAGANIEEHGNNDFTPLAVAAYKGRVEAVLLLISKGADIEASSADVTCSPLWAAVRNGHEQMVNTLLRAGAQVNRRADNRNTLLMLAVELGNYNIIRGLLQFGANPRLRGADEWTAIDVAASRGRSDIVDLLLTDFFARSQISFAAQSERVPAVLSAAPAPVAAMVVNRNEEADELPQRFLCPISSEPMTDPVTLPNGQTFDRPSLIAWSATKGHADFFPCPVTRDQVPVSVLTYGTNISLKEEIDERLRQVAAARPRNDGSVQRLGLFAPDARTDYNANAGTNNSHLVSRRA
jgi:hypothetical protein